MSDAENLIVTARNIIGEGDSDYDWKIVPTEHADMFEEQAPSLAANLRDSRTTGLAGMYEELNSQAMEARDTFKKNVGLANWGIFGTAVLGAVLLVAGVWYEPPQTLGHWVIGIIGVLGFVSGGLATMWLNRVRGGDLAGRWTSIRASAEAKRLTYFKSVLQGATDDPWDRLLALEYTRRFLLDNQIDYFRDRGGKHEKAADLAVNKATRALFVAATCTGIAGLLSVLLPKLAALAGVSVIASAFAAMAESWTKVNLDRRNADRYRAARYQLLERKLDIDIYRNRTAAGDLGAPEEFFEPVFVTLEADHKAFLSDAEQRELAIGQMERRLDQASQSLQPQNRGGPHPPSNESDKPADPREESEPN